MYGRKNANICFFVDGKWQTISGYIWHTYGSYGIGIELTKHFGNLWGTPNHSDEMPPVALLTWKSNQPKAVKAAIPWEKSTVRLDVEDRPTMIAFSCWTFHINFAIYWVYDTEITRVHGLYKPTNITFGDTQISIVDGVSLNQLITRGYTNKYSWWGF